MAQEVGNGQRRTLPVEQFLLAKMGRQGAPKAAGSLKGLPRVCASHGHRGGRQRSGGRRHWSDCI